MVALQDEGIKDRVTQVFKSSFGEGQPSRAAQQETFTLDLE